MNQGSITYLGKGFGFLKVEGHKKEIFFHAKELVNGVSFGELVIGDKLQFEELADTEKGPAAVGVSFA